MVATRLIFTNSSTNTHTVLFWLLIIILVLVSSTQASKPINDGRCTAHMVSTFSRVPNFRFFSGLARGCRPPRVEHISHNISINFQPISMKFKFDPPICSPRSQRVLSIVRFDKFSIKFWVRILSGRCVIRLLCELITLTIHTAQVQQIQK